MTSKESFVFGFIAGEGSFCVKARKRDCNYGYAFSPTFEIHVNERERNTLEHVAETLPVECAIYDTKQDSSQLHVGGVEKCKRLADWIDEESGIYFQYSEKHTSFSKWKEILEIIDDNGHQTPEGSLKIFEIRDGMNGEGQVNKESLSDARRRIASFTE